MAQAGAGMSPARYMSAPEAEVLDAMLPPGLTADMRDMALCLFEAMVLADARAGSQQLAAEWAAQLTAWARTACMQLQHLAEQKGGRAIYLAKGVAVHLSARDEEMCEQFRGNNYRELATQYGLTEMRVRQIIDAWQRARFAQRQGTLDIS